MSPVKTATRSDLESNSSVRSRRLVLPDPGELMRLTHRIPCSWNRSRNPDAMRAFSLSTFCPNSTRCIFLYLHKSEIQFVSPNTIAVHTLAVRALQVIVPDHKLQPAVPAFPLSRTGFDFKKNRLELGPLNNDFERESQCRRVYPSKLANAKAHPGHSRIRIARSLFSDCLERCFRYPKFVHKPSQQMRGS